MSGQDINEVVIFDLDSTITKRDTYLDFLIRYLLRHPWRLLNCWFLPFAVLNYKLGFRDNSWLKETFLAAVAAGAEKEALEKFTHQFVEHTLENNFLKRAGERIREHKNKGDYLIMASASFDFYVIQIAQSLGFDKVICTLSDWQDNNRLSGKIKGKNCYGENKKNAVEKVLKETPYSGSLYVYSDHHSDLPVLLMADIATAVNPSEKLKDAAQEHRIVIEEWDS